MKICVLGLTHLGTVVSICAAQAFHVVALDDTPGLALDCAEGRLPVFEEGLEELRRDAFSKGSLEFTDDAATACNGADVLWVCYDTPVNDDNSSDSGFVLGKLSRVWEHIKPGAIVLLSSQLLVGTCEYLASVKPEFHFAVSPENLQIGKAVSCFMEADRVIVGCKETDKKILTELFFPFTKNIVFVEPVSAEMTKHALNCFLSMSIAFANEIGRLCEKTGANVREVEKALKSDVRIGSKARLCAGTAYEGSSLAREVDNVRRLGEKHRCNLKLLPAVAVSNAVHRDWTLDKVTALFCGQPKLKVAILGLTFKPGSRSVKRSGALVLAKELHTRGFEVVAYDPMRPELPEDVSFVIQKCSVDEAVFEADVAVVMTPWPEFLKVDWRWAVQRNMRRRVIVDPNGFLSAVLKGVDVQLISVGSVVDCGKRPGL